MENWPLMTLFNDFTRSTALKVFFQLGRSRSTHNKTSFL